MWKRGEEGKTGKTYLRYRPCILQLGGCCGGKGGRRRKGTRGTQQTEKGTGKQEGQTEKENGGGEPEQQAKRYTRSKRFDFIHRKIRPESALNL